MIGTAVPLTHKLSKSEAEKITIYVNLALKIENIWTFNNMSTPALVISAVAGVNEPF